MTSLLIIRDLRIIFKDRGTLLLGFAVPVVLFTLFVLIFGGMSTSSDIGPIRLIVVDEDQSTYSQRLVRLLENNEALKIYKDREAEDSNARVPYTRESARDAVAGGHRSVALVIPKDLARDLEGNLFAGPDSIPPITILYDASVPVESQIVQGFLHQALFMSFTDLWAVQGIDHMAAALGIDDETSGRMTSWMTDLFDEIQSEIETKEGAADSSETNTAFGPPVPIETIDVLGETKKNPMAAMTAAQVVVMFLLFSVMGAASSILREQEGGTLRRLLISPMTDWQFLMGKMGASSILGFLQILVMYVYGWAVFHVDLFRDFPAVVVMTAVCALSASALGLLLASLCRNHRQVDAVSTLVVLSMSAVGGSMIPRFLMPKWMQNIGLASFNAWAIDGFYKIFWREMGIVDILPQLGVLIASGTVFFFIASHIFRKRFYT